MDEYLCIGDSFFLRAVLSISGPLLLLVYLQLILYLTSAVCFYCSEAMQLLFFSSHMEYLPFPSIWHKSCNLEMFLPTW